MTRRRTPLDFLRANGRTEQRLRDSIRRMVAAAAGAAWSLTGHRDELGQAERVDAEVFANLGYTARPGAESSTEAIVVTVEGAANHQVVVATRDQSAERAVVELAGLAAGETLLFNTAGAPRIVKLTRDGDILIGAPGANFQPVALADHTHAAPAITGQAQYVDPDARTGPPDSVTEHLKAT